MVQDVDVQDIGVQIAGESLINDALKMMWRPMLQVSAAPAAGSVATATAAAGGLNVRHRARFLVASARAAAALAAAYSSEVVIRDGAAGAGTIIWRTGIALPTVTVGVIDRVIVPLSLDGTANTAMTVEMLGGAAGVSLTVWLGYEEII